MRTLILARHAHAESNHGETVSGVAPGAGLTAVGVEQARRLGRELAGEPVELAVVTEFGRTAETAEVALAGRDVPRLVIPALNEIGFGRFEGRLLDDYRAWAWAAPADELCPGDGESRGLAAGRYAGALDTLLERPERMVLAIAHALPIRYVLEAAAGHPPVARIEPVPHAQPFRLEHDEVARAAELLRRWSEAPTFA